MLCAPHTQLIPLLSLCLGKTLSAQQGPYGVTLACGPHAYELQLEEQARGRKAVL